MKVPAIVLERNNCSPRQALFLAHVVYESRDRGRDPLLDIRGPAVGWQHVFVQVGDFVTPFERPHGQESSQDTQRMRVEATDS